MDKTQPTMKKFLQSLDDKFFDALEKESQQRGINLQELVRAVIVPEWVKINKIKV